MPPTQDVATLTAEQFDNAAYWTFMEIAAFDQGCSASAVASAGKVQGLIRSATVVRQVRFVGGIEVVVLPDRVAGPYVDVNVAFDPWPAWIFGQILNAWNSVWNLATVTAALCPPAVLPTVAPAKTPTATPPSKPPAPPSLPPPPPPPPPPLPPPHPPMHVPIVRIEPACSGLGGQALYLCTHGKPPPPTDPCAGLYGRALFLCRHPGVTRVPIPSADPCAGLYGRALFVCQHPGMTRVPIPSADPCAGLWGRGLFLCRHPRRGPPPGYGEDYGDVPCIGPSCYALPIPSAPMPNFSGYGSHATPGQTNGSSSRPSTSTAR
jgi:hypothetical protein